MLVFSMLLRCAGLVHNWLCAALEVMQVLHRGDVPSEEAHAFRLHPQPLKGRKQQTMHKAAPRRSPMQTSIAAAMASKTAACQS